MGFLANKALRLLRWYQFYLSPDHRHGPGRRVFCRFSPTCSEYAAQCLEKYPLPKALAKSFWRIIRCLPGLPYRIDVP